MPHLTNATNKAVTAEVHPTNSVIARKGAMLAYTGTVQFTPVGTFSGGVAGAAGRMLAGESTSTMVAQGTGKVWYGYEGLHVTVVDVNGMNALTVEADRLLCYDEQLTVAVVPVNAPAQGGGGGGGLRGMLRGAVTGQMTGQGLFTTRLTGLGQAAILSHGGAFTMPVTNIPVHVDPQAFVAASGNVVTELVRSGGLRDLVGAGSDEQWQLRLTGQGTVWVQNSEEKR